MHLAQIERQEIEEERALTLGGDGEQITTRGPWRMAVDVLQVGRFSTVARAIVHDFALYLAFGDVDERHAPFTPSLRAAMAPRLILKERVNRVGGLAAELHVHHLLPRLPRAMPHSVEDTLQLVATLARQHLDQPHMGLPIKDDDEQPLLADQVAEDIFLDALLQDAAEVSLTENLGNLARGGERARHQRAERHQITLARFPMRGDELAALVDQDGVAGAGVDWSICLAISWLLWKANVGIKTLPLCLIV